MANKKHNKQKLVIEKAKKNSPHNVDWELCTEAVDSLQQWIEELCLENHRLKKTLAQVISRLQKDNQETKKILNGINLPDLNSTDTEDH